MSIFGNIFDSMTESIGPVEFLECIACALVLGAFLSAVYILKNKHTGSFALTICVLPAIVASIIMVVDGNIGAGIAVAGAFSLVRFRSAPGNAREIAVIFLSMAVGLLCGMGFVVYAAVFAVILGAIIFAAGYVKVFSGNNGKRVLRITVPEDLDYTAGFEDVLSKYTSSSELVSVKTVNMGSMFRLTYDVVLKDEKENQRMINELRVRNGNLEVALFRSEPQYNEL